MDKKVVNKSESVKVLGIVIRQDKEYSVYLVTREKNKCQKVSKHAQTSVKIQGFQDKVGPSRGAHPVQNWLLHLSLGHHDQGKPRQDPEGPEQGCQDSVWEEGLQSCLTDRALQEAWVA